MKSIFLKLGTLCISLLLMILFVENVAAARKKLPKPILKIEISEDGKVSGFFTKDGRTIFFEAIRGEENTRDDPKAPPFSVDARIMDGNHVPFVYQTGGHELLDLSWKEEYQMDSDQPVDEDERALDFAMLPSMVKALKKYVSSHKRYRTEIKTLISIGTIREADLYDSDDDVAIEDQDMTFKTNQRVYKHRIAIHKKKAFDILKADHSAVQLKIYDSGSGKLLLVFNTTNHGTSAKDMNEKCHTSILRYDTNVYIWDKACDAFGFPYGVHVCNNDTKQEFQSQYNGGTQHWGYCVPLMPYAPDCN